MIERLLPRSLAGRMIALTLIALALAQVVSYLILSDERRIAIMEVRREQVLDSVAAIVWTLRDTPPQVHDHILANASTRRLQFRLASGPVEAAKDGGGAATYHLKTQLAEMLAGQDVGTIHIGLTQFDAAPEAFRAHENEHRQRRDMHPEEPRQPVVLTFAIDLKNGSWLNAQAILFAPRVNWAFPSLLTMGLGGIAILAVIVLTVGRITRPLRALAEASERLGRGEDIPPLVETGPQDLAEATRAFNRMNARLHRYLKDRTTMLAAIAHDLRTPVTTLRLKAEFIEDEAVRADIGKTLDEMQHLAEATLAFAREEAHAEETRPVRLDALLGSLADDMAQSGSDVTFADAPPLTYACRDRSLTRALRNLIENAVRYGHRARVALEADADLVRIVIDDDGPGIPESEHERIFEPFTRLEESRNVHTGGIGLGLAIARSIVRSHGGDITPTNRPEGGLRITITLPARPA